MSEPIDPSTGPGAATGEQYLDRLRDGREVWLAGEKVDVTTHPAFEGMRTTLAHLYDLQHEPEFAETMTCESAEHPGRRISYSYLPPTTPEELLRKRSNTETWARETWGQVARLPDFTANITVGIRDFHTELEANGAGFGTNAVRYNQHAAGHDLLLTHALGDPQIDRSASPSDDPTLALRIVEETDRGVVVEGAKQLATLAPLAHEVLVYLSASFALRDKPEFVLWFALPLNAPGLRIVCREPLAAGPSGYAHPFATQFDEQDALLIFDRVEIPWERVFLKDDGRLALRGHGRIVRWGSYVSSVRLLERFRTYIAVASMVAESIGVDQFREIRGKLGELVSYADLIRLAVRGMEAEAYQTANGFVSPGQGNTVGVFSAQISGRVSEIVREIAASGLVMQPSEADLGNAELRPFLDLYMRGRNVDVATKSRLLRLAWDLVGDGYGSRQELYEHLQRGDLTRNRIRAYEQFDQTEVRARLTKLLSEPMPERVPLP